MKTKIIALLMLLTLVLAACTPSGDVSDAVSDDTSTSETFLTKEQEIEKYLSDNNKATIDILSKNYNSKISIPDVAENIRHPDGREQRVMTQKYVETVDKAISLLESKKLSLDDARTLFIFVFDHWSLYLETKGMKNSADDFPELYEALTYYLSVDEKLEGDLNAALDPGWYWTKGAPFGNADRLEK